MTIRRTFIILILLAIVFFVYRGVDPSGADKLLTNIRNIPVRVGFVSRKLVISPKVSSGGDLTSSGNMGATGTIISKIIPPTKQIHVFTSSLVSGGTFPLAALVSPPKVPKKPIAPKVHVFTSSLLSGGTFALEALLFTPAIIPATGEALVFSSTLASGGLFAMEALVIPQQNTTPIREPIATGGSLTIVSPTPVVEEKPIVATKPTVVVKPVHTAVVVQPKPSSSRITAQDISLLNNLFQ